MALYVYALLSEAPRAPGKGLCGEQVRLVPCGSMFAAAGDVGAAPPLDAASLRAHDEVVRRLARRAEAILPARFGWVLPDEGALARAAQAREAALREALTLVAGREQMTLRVFDRRPAREPEAPVPEGAGPGATYLLRAARARALPALDPLRPLLAELVAAERVQLHRAPPLVASVYHLIPRGAAKVYERKVRSASRGPLRLHVSGPRPPYAFAPGAAR